MKHFIKKIALLSLVLSLNQTIICAEEEIAPKESIVAIGTFIIFDLIRYKIAFSRQKAALKDTLFAIEWSIRKPKLLESDFLNFRSLKALEEHYQKVKKEKNFDHIKCAYALKDVYNKLADLEWRQCSTLPRFLKNNEKWLARLGFTFFINRKNQLERSYASGFFNWLEPQETATSLRNLKLSPAEIAETWAMTK